MADRAGEGPVGSAAEPARCHHPEAWEVRAVVEHLAAVDPAVRVEVDHRAARVAGKSLRKKIHSRPPRHPVLNWPTTPVIGAASY